MKPYHLLKRNKNGKRGNTLIKFVKVILAITVISLSIYCKTTSNFEMTPFIMLSSGLLFLTIGITELQKNRKEFWGYMSIIFSLLMFFVSIEGFL